jgi:signal transduction histidine kinase
MAGKLNTLAGRMVLVLLLIHAVLLPALFYGVVLVVENSQTDAFIDDSRIYARIIADTLESEAPRSNVEIIRQLDSAILSGTGVFASLLHEGQHMTSSLVSDGDRDHYKEDFSFGGNSDDTYFLSLPVELRGEVAVLRLGFDELPTLADIEKIRSSVFAILLGYVVISIVLVIILGTLLARPIQRIRQLSRKIASGAYSKKMKVTSPLYEINELARDLETMRSKIVGANFQLQEVNKERQLAEAEQRSLEARLRHSHRLESVGTLAGGIAHEFNNVLAPIVLYTDLALEDLPADSDARPKLKRVMSLAHRAKGLSKQILSFSSRYDEVEHTAIDIADVVEESLSLLRALVPATIEIRTNIKHQLGRVLCDPAEIQQLVVNLGSNAFRSLSKGGGYMQIDVDREVIGADLAARRPRLRVGTYIVLVVSDSGAGMDDGTIERIFEPFFTTQEVGQGSGLGLSVVHGIVVRHDGDIIVSSTPGKGSTFRVFLPLLRRRASERQQALGI